MTKLTCAKCDKPVDMVDGEIKRNCDCNEAVIAHLSATARGASSVASSKAR